MAQANQEVIGLLRRKEDRGVLADISITPQAITIRENIVVLVHLDRIEKKLDKENGSRKS